MMSQVIKAKKAEKNQFLEMIKGFKTISEHSAGI
jgi:hypothetical protein